MRSLTFASALALVFTVHAVAHPIPFGVDWSQVCKNGACADINARAIVEVRTTPTYSPSDLCNLFTVLFDGLDQTIYAADGVPDHISSLLDDFFGTLSGGGSTILQLDAAIAAVASAYATAVKATKGC